MSPGPLRSLGDPACACRETGGPTSGVTSPTGEQPAGGGRGIRMGDPNIQHWRTLQYTFALSSGEAEVNACVKGTSEGVGLLELLREWNPNSNRSLQLHTDASAAKGTILRRGAGRMKHVTTKQLCTVACIGSRLNVALATTLAICNARAGMN